MPQAFCFDIYMHYKTSERITKQINWSTTKKENLWRLIIKEKINGQMYNIETLSTNKDVYNSLASYYENLDFCSDDDINVQEAVSARVYFKELFGKEFKRHNEDTINYALNYGYSLLRSFIACLITAKGLHPSISISHQNIFNTYNLADDIIEVFRPLVDSIVYAQLQYFDEFTKEFRKEILEILLQEVMFNNRVVPIKTAVNLFLDSIINYFDDDTEVVIPSIEVSYARV